MDNFKAIPCKSRPDWEFLVDLGRPKSIGARLIGSSSRAWFNKKLVEGQIKKLEKDLEFWRELRDLLEL